MSLAIVLGILFILWAGAEAYVFFYCFRYRDVEDDEEAAEYPAGNYRYDSANEYLRNPRNTDYR